MNKITYQLAIAVFSLISLFSFPIASFADELWIRDVTGDVHNENGEHLGTIRDSGDVYRYDGTRLGKVGDNGEVYDNDANRLGKVWENGDVQDNDGNYIGKVNSLAEAALLFFFN